ncbi:hypothetical protein QMA61_29110 [Streptomyces coelicoflavus]|nr:MULTISPECIES: hypothetical protein [Streptomyces]MDI6520241.1 hypothetical protein [Streptomyces coelicoflavus]
MGIRMLHPRTTPARARTDGPARVPLLPVPVFAPGASTGRTPATLTTALRHTAKDIRRSLARKAPAAPATSAVSAPHETPAWRLWAGLARGYLALALSLLPRPRPARTFTVFVASADPLGARRGGPAPY